MKTSYLALAASVAACFAQTVAPEPAFEAASVKLSTAEATARKAMMGGPGTARPGNFTVVNMTLRYLVMRAYEVSYWRPYLIVGPAALDRDRYDIEARVPVGATQQQLFAMLRNLLAERFGLQARWEDRSQPVYELKIARGGQKLTLPGSGPTAPATTQAPLRDKDGWPVPPAGAPFIGWNDKADGAERRVDARMQRPADLLEMLERSGSVDRPCFDKTGLTGLYDFTLTFALPSATHAPQPPIAPAGPAESASDPGTDLSAALERQLGLRLEPAKAPVKVLLVEKVNSRPTTN